MSDTKNNHTQDDSHHITGYAEHFGTYVSLIMLTFMTVFISVFGADLNTLTVATAMFIASVKVLIVAYYFMHLKYDPKVYRVMILLVMAMFVIFLIMLMFDYLTR
ncbi:MAG: cytochrome C oxidase subunit IV family protein [Bacteroidales bacterium]|jgi:cytochrome c oxidase subunit IV|nr:cytochrome C oxidase subunit IV family protein [Bacteroidales bacterium]MDG2080756.1 cytochrome C oxidase subunit IV family protein [Bacteroidales bacterium]|tara:strand:- start:6956 stop:7270 length:315 start_codon:yes stop_codon:yes gene_type:complete